MNSYKITVVEILKREVTVEANSIGEALTKAEKQWHSSEIVLDADDFCAVEFFPGPVADRILNK